MKFLKRKSDVIRSHLTLFEAIKPLLWLLQLIGLNLAPSHSPTKMQLVFSCVMPIVMIALGPISWYYYCLSRNFKRDTEILSANIGYICQNFIFYLTYVSALYRRSSLVQLLLKVNNLLMELGPEGQTLLKTMRRWCRVIAFIPYFCVGYSIGIFYVYIFCCDPYFLSTGRWPLYGVHYSLHANGHKPLLLRYYRLCFIALLHAFVFVIAVLFIVLSAAHRVMKGLDSQTESRKDISTVAQLTTSSCLILRRHRLVVEIVKLVNECFGEVIVVCFTFGWSTFILLMRSANIGTSRGVAYQMDTVVICSYDVVVLYVLIFLSGIIKGRVEKKLSMLNLLPRKFNSSLDLRSTALAVKLDLYMDHVRLSTPSISCHGLFTVDRKIAIPMAGSILTYLLVLYDK